MDKIIAQPTEKLNKSINQSLNQSINKVKDTNVDVRREIQK